MISFVISTFNRPKDLRVLLSSLLAQTSDEWEAIVMDEGSNGWVVDGMQDERISRHFVERQILTTDGRGSIGYLAKHAGVEHVRGEHIAFASDDIYYLPQFVEKMNGHDKDIIGCNMFINYTRGINCLSFLPQVPFADCGNYIIKPQTYKFHPFTEFIPDNIGIADGLCVERCVADGASWQHIPLYLSLHGNQRP